MTGVRHLITNAVIINRLRSVERVGKRLRPSEFSMVKDGDKRTRTANAHGAYLVRDVALAVTRSQGQSSGGDTKTCSIHGVCKHDIALRGDVQHGVVQHGFVQHGVVQHGGVRCGGGRRGAVGLRCIDAVRPAP